MNFEGTQFNPQHYPFIQELYVKSWSRAGACEIQTLGDTAPALWICVTLRGSGHTWGRWQAEQRAPNVHVLISGVICPEMSTF